MQKSYHSIPGDICFRFCSVMRATKMAKDPRKLQVTSNFGRELKRLYGHPHADGLPLNCIFCRD